MEGTEYQTVILAAFLHDIGKFLGRGSFKILDKGQHPAFSSTFISAHGSFFSNMADVPLLKELVQKHHENSRATMLSVTWVFLYSRGLEGQACAVESKEVNTSAIRIGF